ncbi:hypothetical protein GU926_00320 [Nibribacter ruber]|uniref:STAS/SEC14 domain-containing protein n=1 Tax=Nibribacter ruber TaxID=2698458 RepID=A0A6P1NUM6_9BACT|nr:STAS/SEC14 domain-containing protein [Nibribacter ruber]QHL85969.1 hypothetical protein GU926_00320 [Nibribacter ruber]
MVEIINTTAPDLVAVRVTGTLHKTDYQQLLPALEKKLADHEKINLYWHMYDFTGWTLQGLLEDLSFECAISTTLRRLPWWATKPGSRLWPRP